MYGQPNIKLVQLIYKGSFSKTTFAIGSIMENADYQNEQFSVGLKF
jgi:hypothetical protein